MVAGELEVLAESDPLPFPIEGGGELNEDVRLHYRYLDIRRAETAAALRTRSRATYLVNDVMREHGFVNVETPYLTRSTPEGARDFLVPVRLRPGHWYALPQSPQLFKQLLMVGGLERYWQLARCFRDEDFRADRQPEFTQVDIEMSFVTRDDVITVAEDMVARLWAEIAGYDLARPIPRMTYADAMDRFGSDKPDLRFGCELADLTGYFAQTSFRVFQAPYVGAVVMPGGAAQSRRELDGWQEWARARGARGLALRARRLQRVGVGRGAGGPAPGGRRAGRPARGGRRAARATVCSSRRARRRRPSRCSARPAWRSAAGSASSTRPPGRSPGWWTRPCSRRTARAAGPRCTTRSPRRCPSGRTSSWPSRAGRWPTPTTWSATARRSAAGRSVSTAPPCSSRSSTSSGCRGRRRSPQFGFLLEALRFGPPPHGGIAFGWDRLIMLLAGRDTIRDVIAFPKAASGLDPLTGAPTPITPQQRKEAGIDVILPPDGEPPDGEPPGGEGPGA